MADKQPITVAELILELLQFEGDLEVGVILHTRLAGLIRGHLVGKGLIISTPYVNGHKTVQLEATDVVHQRRKDKMWNKDKIRRKK